MQGVRARVDTEGRGLKPRLVAVVFGGKILYLLSLMKEFF
jgi:hypothetical protein